MATTTTNLGLSKPAYSDDADVAVINGNMDILDTKIGAVGNTSVQAQINTNSEAIATINDKATVNAVRVANGDMNTLTTPGVYACDGCSNAPLGVLGWFTLEVLPMGAGSDGNTNYATQRAVQLSSENVFVRSRSNGTWNAWKQVALKNNSLTVVQTQINIPSVTVNSGQMGVLMSSFNLRNATHASLDTIPSTGTIIGIQMLWSSGSTCVQIDSLVDSDQLASLRVINLASGAQTVTAVRLLVFLKGV